MISLDPVNILLVDDQPAKLLSYEVILEELGERLLKASSGREALALLLKHEVAVVLIDVQMPEQDGFELAAMIRDHPRFERTAIIFVSAIHLSDIDRIKGYEAGGVDYVPVPVVPEVLRAKVRVFAELYRKTRDLARLNAELEQRIAERTAALARLNEELEIRIEERTREREQAMAQLFEAQKLDTIGQLTGGVAHDFNNLLMAVMGSAQLLRKRLDGDASSRRLLDNVLQGAERGVALTQRLLAFARRQELKADTVELPALIDGMMDLLSKALGPLISVNRDLAADITSVRVDANQLELALLNLAINARDAMAEGGVVTILARNADQSESDAPAKLAPGDYVRLSVIDTGVGMEADVLARAAEPFFTTKGVGKGTGLGLSMVHGLAGQSGGGLRLSSRPGEGARVDLWLPRAEAPCAPRASEDQGGASEHPAEQLTVMLVDDDHLVRSGIAAMLEDLGHVVVEAESGAEALRLLETGGPVDCVITDHAMPGMTGLDLARRLRTLRPQLRVVLASGFADIDEGETGLFQRLSKPFLQTDLAEALDRLQAGSVQA